MQIRRRVMLTLPGLAAVPLAACSREGDADVGAVEVAATDSTWR
jgi:hypothetical protein